MLFPTLSERYNTELLWRLSLFVKLESIKVMIALVKIEGTTDDIPDPF